MERQVEPHKANGQSEVMDVVRDVLATKPLSLAYCDYIAYRIKQALSVNDPLMLTQIVKTVGNVKSDLHPVGGYLLSTKKTIAVTDRNGRHYTITVEEAP